MLNSPLTALLRLSSRFAPINIIGATGAGMGAGNDPHVKPMSNRLASDRIIILALALAIIAIAVLSFLATQHSEQLVARGQQLQNEQKAIAAIDETAQATRTVIDLVRMSVLDSPDAKVAVKDKLLRSTERLNRAFDELTTLREKNEVLTKSHGKTKRLFDSFLTAVIQLQNTGVSANDASVENELLTHLGTLKQAQMNRLADAQSQLIATGDKLDQLIFKVAISAFALLALLIATFWVLSNKSKQDARALLHAAMYDPLTTLANRTLFLDRLNGAVLAAQRHERPLVLMLFDLDGFKAVNDSLGHAAGDRLLQAVSVRASRELRGVDTLARVGGDEFMLLLPETSREGAMRTASKLLERVQRPYSIESSGERKRVDNVGISIGIALFPDDADNVESLLKAADSSMYSAKRAGKNCYKFFSDGVTVSF